MAIIVRRAQPTSTRARADFDKNAKRHFVKFSPACQTFLANILSPSPPDSEALQTEAVKRLTTGGQLIYTRFLNRERPSLPTIGIQGDGFAAEAVLDRARPDALFVFHVSPLPREDRRNGASQSARLSLEWLPQMGNPPELEFAGHIFAGLQQGYRMATERPNARLALLPEVKAALAGLGVDLRAQLMAAQLQAGSDEAPDLKTLRDAWRTFVQRSGRSPAVGAADRMERILSGDITPKDVPLSDLWTTLQRVVLSRTLPEAKGRPAELNAIVSSFVESRLASDQTVALLWQASLSGADLSVLEAALVGLGATWKHAEPREEQPWWDAVCEVHKNVDGGGSDSEIGHLIESIDNEDQSLITALIAWAQEREPRNSAPVETVSAPVEPLVVDLTVLAGRLDDSEIEGWIERVEGPSGVAVAAARVDVQKLARDLMTWGEADTPMLITCLNELHERTTRFLQDHELLFSDHRTKKFAELRASAKRQLGQAFGAIQGTASGVDHVRAALQNDTMPSRLLRAAELIMDPLVSVLPAWWWQGEPFEELLKERIANDTQSLIELIGELDEGQRSRLTAQPVPTKGTDRIDYLLDLVTDIKEGLGDDRDKYPGLANLYDDGLINRAGFQAKLKDLDDVLGALLPTFEEAALSYCLPPDFAGESIDRIRKARKAVEDLRMSGDEGPFRWPEILRQIPHKAPDAQDHTGPQLLGLGFANVGTWYMLDGNRVTIPDHPPLLFSADRNSPFGTVAVPLVIKSDQAGDLTLDIEVLFGPGRLRELFPADVAASVSPTRLTLRARDWHSNDAGYTVTVPLTIPLRSPENGEELSFTVTARSAGQILATAPKSTWNKWIKEGHKLQDGPKWTEGENPDAAAHAPIGIQARFEAILKRLNNGQSCIAMAPRRFGKSSLLALIGQRIPAAVTVNCSLFIGTGIHQGVWQDVTKKLRESYTGVPELSKLEDVKSALLPWLVERNLRLVLLFDEAQYLFDGAGPAEVQLWREVLQKGRLAICFVGLPQLKQVAQTDLAAVALPYEKEVLPDNQLARLVRHMAGSDFYTTVAVRERLAKLATNLHILKVLVTRLDQLATEERRCWVSEEDVVRVEGDLKKELTHGRLADGILTYLADAVNAGNPNHVRLLDVAPVAVAYALALEDGEYGARESTKATLELWSKDAGEERALSLATVDEALKQLTSNELLKDRGRGRGFVFASELQRCFFVGAVQDLRDDAVWGTGSNIAEGGKFKDVLLRLGIPRVELPLSWLKLAEGAQAVTYTFDRQKTKMVARVRSLASEDERRVFLRHLQTADIIRELHDTNDPAAAGIYKLKELGLNAKNEREAVETYPYIDGLVLSEKECSVAEVVELGIALGQALAVLHSRGILHRDIAPRNIIVQPGGHPVLIDFGLACIDAIVNHTRLAGEYAAPEVLRVPPLWSSAADVFALSSTLKTVLAPQGLFHDRLQKLLTDIGRMEPESRQDVSAVLVKPLQALQNKLVAAEPVERLLNDLKPLTEADNALRTAVVADSGAIKQLRSVALGYAASEAQRRRVIADLVDLYLKHKLNASVGELIPSRGRPNAPLMRTDGLSALQTLRNDNQHPNNNDAEVQRALRLSRDQFVDGCQTIADHVASPNLVSVVRKVLDWSDT